MRKHQGEGRRLEETADRKTKITQNKSAIKEERGIKDERRTRLSRLVGGFLLSVKLISHPGL